MTERRITRDELARVIPKVRVPMKYVGGSQSGAGWFERDAETYADRLMEAAVASRKVSRESKEKW